MVERIIGHLRKTISTKHKGSGKIEASKARGES
jgi:hypothetical protein